MVSVSGVLVILGFLSLGSADQDDYWDEAMGLSTNGTSLDEYDFQGSDEGFNDTVTVFTDEAEGEMPLKEAATMLLLAQIEQLKNTTWEKEAEIQNLHSHLESITAKFAEDNVTLLEESKKQQEALIQRYEKEKAALVEEWTTEKASMVEEWKNEKASLIEERNLTVQDLQRRKNLEKAKYEKDLTNKRVLVRFLSHRLRKNDNRAKVSRDVIEAQNEKLRILGEERKTYQEKNKMFLRQAYLQADEIMRQETQKTALKDALKIEVGLQQDYCNLTKLLQDNPVGNFPSYVSLLTKSLTDQTEEINKLRSFTDEESQIEVQTREVLEEMKKLNVTFSTDTEEWDLLGSLTELVKVQSDSLTALKPTISYVVKNNRGFDYVVNEKGLLKSISPCQCLPKTEGTSLAVSGIQFACPTGKADPVSAERNGVVTCLDGTCPATLTEDLCVDSSSIWSEWTPCLNCLVASTRWRQGTNGEKEIDTKGVTTPLIVTTSSTLNVTIPQGYQLSVFVVGGGGAASGGTAGSSGFFEHETLNVDQTQSFVLEVTIGRGGMSNGASGESTTVQGLPSIVSAQGGGGSGGPGWSGVSGDTGGSNGQYGNNEPLPNLCGVSLTPGAAGYGSSDGKGAGGVVVDGRKPARTSSVDGEGFGAGGGEDNRHGYPGVVILSLCEL